MSLKRIYAIFVRQLFLIKSNPVRLASIFLWVIIDIVQWGFITKYLGTFGQATFSFITVILGAVILWEFMTRIQQGIMTSFLEDIWSRNFVNFFASPLLVREYVAGLVLTSIITGSFGFVCMVLIAGLAFGYNIFKIGLLLIPFALILFIFGVAVGIFVSAMVFRLGPSAEWLSWPIPWILSLFAGVFYPIATLPKFLQYLARLLPPSYIFESMRNILARGNLSQNLVLNLIIGGILALIYLFLMYVFFIRIYRRNLRTGSLAKFSAEEY
jgi:ABC-2 type transport system permease protein